MGDWAHSYGYARTGDKSTCSPPILLRCVTADTRPNFAIPASVLYRQVNEQMVLLNLASEQYFGLDKVGARILERITQEPFNQALAELESDYDVDPEVLHHDVDTLIGQLIAAGLLERVDSD